MLHLRLLVEFETHAVSAEVAHHSVTVFVGVLLDGVADVANKTIRLAGCDAHFEALLGYAHKAFLGGSSLADDVHTRSVGVIAVEDCGDVHIDDVALFEHHVVARNAVANLLVDGDAATLRKALKTKRCGRCAVRNSVFVYEFVDFVGGHTGVDVFSHEVEERGIDDAAPAHTFYLPRREYQTAPRHEFALVLPIENLLVHLRKRLTLRHKPISFLSKKTHFYCYRL